MADRPPPIPRPRLFKETPGNTHQPQTQETRYTPLEQPVVTQSQQISKHAEHKQSLAMAKEKGHSEEKENAGVQQKQAEDERDQPQIRSSKVKRRTDHPTAIKQNKHPKTTYLYLRFDQLVIEGFDFHGFLMERLQNQQEMNFEIVTSRKVNKNCTIITLKFESRRLGQRAQNLIKISNRDSQIKIGSSFELADVDDSKKVDKDEAIFQGHLQAILDRAEKTMTKHDEKMKSTSADIEKLKTSRFKTLDAYERVKTERFALEDKLKELTLQLDEFKLFLESLTAKLKQCWYDNTYDKNVDEIRKLFGVECCRLDAALPMYARRSEIVKIVKNNKVCVILGETGSGKSTQMTQYLHQVGLANDGLIICTQPRKVAAISLATRVASEMATNVGQLVGYRVGMKSKVCGNTKIIYTTDHALLNECLKDTTLSKYSCIIIDEAHERSIYTDLLLGMIKECLGTRSDLRVIITSATIDPEVFVHYFNGCPVLKVSGRMFPVEVIWQPLSGDVDVFENYQRAAVQKAVDIHQRTPKDGDILVFMTTPLETEKCSDEFRQVMKDDNSFQCLVLHGQVQAEEQQLVFQPNPAGKRKIVFATNSAETSITIPGIKYVVDTGLVKEKRYDSKRNMSSLSVVMISRSSAEQRKGRAGRTGPGTCYRLYTEEHHKSMDSSSLPEILKVHLGQAMLKLAELGINPLEYAFVQSPGTSAIEGAMKMLEDIGAIKDQRITETGKWLSKLPVEPRLGSIIAKGKECDLLYESVILSTVSSVGSFIFYRGSSETDKKKSDSQKIQFCHYGGDSMSLLNVFREWDKQEEKKKNKWCFENSVNSKAIRNAREMVNEICTVLKKELGLTVKHSFDDPSNTDKMLQNILFECFSSNICHFLGHERAGYYAARLDQLVHIHPSSVLNSLGLVPQWVVFEQVLKTSKDFVTGLTPVEDSLVHEAAQNGTLRYDIEVMKNKQVYLVHTECVGSRAFWRIVGPAFSKLKVLQQTASTLAAPSCAVIEADKEKGEFKIFATRQNSAALAELLKPEIVVVQDELQREDSEHSLSQKPGSVSVVLGAGGEVSQVLMSDDYRTVFIEKADENTSETSIKQKLCQFGVIKECKIFKKRKNDRWGCVKFENSNQAKLAVAATLGDQHEVAVAEHWARGPDCMTFKVKLTWCRRKSKEHAFVKLVPEELPRMLHSSQLWIGGRIFSGISKHGCDKRQNELNLILN
ncbi:LOW QUALITY PROTEIN: pre-mRNA-splicing factor ATP-dependent RNA helicase DEAH10-like [Gigantopelta aegis]|uniref:LOW QUALITY PROTEIN: pre-mRNA-splicing factor ATP-dependent RNA helicase DEAH10-like n=1 Tax=Gigantopelta aegis TaxID=1735272 RepID=UPI001B889320|nr:LOW QUALITY PROTEIN: pre-mRNA-splicing factor ATP-dependent RNA helicase DEAH10-like [Gigantopelta aegis]